MDAGGTGAAKGRKALTLLAALLGVVAAPLLGWAPAYAISQTTMAAPDGMRPPEPPKGAVRWDQLKEAEDPANVVQPKVSAEIVALDGKDIVLRGFMMPLEQAAKQSRFVLTALPPTCPFCLPAGPDQLVEVECADPVKFTFDPVTVAGRFELVRDDPAGLLYRITAARRVGD